MRFHVPCVELLSQVNYKMFAFKACRVEHSEGWSGSSKKLWINDVIIDLSR